MPRANGRNHDLPRIPAIMIATMAIAAAVRARRNCTGGEQGI